MLVLDKENDHTISHLIFLGERAINDCYAFSRGVTNALYDDQRWDQMVNHLTACAVSLGGGLIRISRFSYLGRKISVPFWISSCSIVSTGILASWISASNQLLTERSAAIALLDTEQRTDWYY